MAIKDKEYTFSIDKYNKPNVVEGNTAVGLRLMELITLEPGDDPLHPDMGVGLKNHRYAMDELETLRKKIEEQIRTYLPFYQSVDIQFKITPDKLINIEINLDNTIYVYNSANTSEPIALIDLES